MKALLDTNILIDYLKGFEQARKEMNRHERLLISLISWMEVMAGATPEEEPLVRSFLSGFEPVPVSPEIAERAVAIRRD
ncbi:MAG: type II toxin-antitoxin system VapC family toxin, partial [Deltaproteobacteria bacterium]